MGDLRACGKPRPRSLNFEVYCVTSHIPGPPLAFLRATLKSWERGPGDEANDISCKC